ncbi:cytochrome P450 2J5 [Trichonephila clavipes]|nr:cytochrome P450 2J5 [Trichonephila clavipes]
MRLQIVWPVMAALKMVAALLFKKLHSGSNKISVPLGSRPSYMSGIMKKVASGCYFDWDKQANQDIHINGYVIPKGSDITANLWALHYDPAYWDQPEEFRPERFLTDGGTKLIKNPPSYAPFSIGRRNCPGEKIAWMELLFYFSETLKKFKISPPPQKETEFVIENGLIARLSPQPLCFKERKH